MSSSVFKHRSDPDASFAHHVANGNATGKTLRAAVAHIFQITDGKIVRLRASAATAGRAFPHWQLQSGAFGVPPAH